MQTKEELEDWYRNEDPWAYKNNPEDIRRKQKILEAIPGWHKNGFPRKYKKALDLGCGEGWITQDLPAKEIHGYDLSEMALSRLPRNVVPVYSLDLLRRTKYDLIIATGVLYAHYDYKPLISAIKKHASGIVVLCNIDTWEVPEVKMLKNQIHEETFRYREFNELIRVYDYSAQYRAPQAQQ
jgi:2-polyprenyl-3-methyl-5-hydroxy-6-metoxy-1,4-benzoquinol methylase